MGVGPFSSESRTSQRRRDISGQLTATNGTISQVSGGNRSPVATSGGLALGDNSSLGSRFINAARGATVTVTETADTSGLQDAIDNLVKSQTDHTASALGSVGNIGQPVPASEPGLPLDKILTGSIAAMAVGFLVLVAIIAFRK